MPPARVTLVSPRGAPARALLLVCALAPAARAQPPSRHGPEIGPYVARFHDALAAFDAGDHAAALAGFLRAGELAPEAPVWRASAGLAALRAGDEGTARVLFTAALARGYPPSDLAALCPLGAALAAGVEEAPRAGWVTVAARGLRSIQADVRLLRANSKVPADERTVTHLVGNFQVADGRRLIGVPAVVERFVVHADSGAVERLGDHWDLSSGVLYGVRASDMQDDYVPWPRREPFARALRTGLLVDEGKAPVEASRLRVLHLVAGASAPGRARCEDARRRPFLLDLERLARVTAPSVLTSTRDAPWGLEPVDDPTLRARAAALLPPEPREEVHLLRLTPRGGAPLLLAQRRDPRLVGGVTRGRLPILVLDDGAREVLRRIEAAALEPELPGEGPAQGVGPVAFDAARGELVLAGAWLSFAVALDIETGARAWAGAFPPSRSGFVAGRRASLAVVPADAEHRERGEVVLRAADGALLLDGAPLGLGPILGAAGSGTLLAVGWDSVFLYDADRLDGTAGGAEPLASLWLAEGGVVAVGRDGTWSLPREVTWGRTFALIGDRFVPAKALTPWLLDPLHVRTLAADADLAPRRFPAP